MLSEKQSKALKAPMPYHWRLGRSSKDKKWAFMLAYIDARDVMNRLDEVIGPGFWVDRYYAIGNSVYCQIGVVNEDGSTLFRSDCGGKRDFETEKSAASDAFKRAGVKWGIGRFLYDMKEVILPMADYKKRQYKPEQLAKLCEAKQKPKSSAVNRDREDPNDHAEAEMIDDDFGAM